MRASMISQDTRKPQKGPIREKQEIVVIQMAYFI
jgi:hypothetical protein